MLPNGMPSGTPTTSTSGRTEQATPRIQNRAGHAGRETATPRAAAAIAWPKAEATPTLGGGLRPPSDAPRAPPAPLPPPRSRLRGRSPRSNGNPSELPRGLDVDV